MSTKRAGVSKSASEYLALIRSRLDQGEVLEARRLAGEAASVYPGDHDVTRINKILAPALVTRTPTLDADRTKEFDWLRQHADDFLGKWIAVLDGTLIASAETLRELLSAVEKRALSRPPLIHHVT